MDGGLLECKEFEISEPRTQFQCKLWNYTEKNHIHGASVTSGSDPHGTCNVDSDGHLKQSWTSEGGLEAGICLDVDKHTGGAPAYLYTSTNPISTNYH